jgi:hypothetical protein
MVGTEKKMAAQQGTAPLASSTSRLKHPMNAAPDESPVITWPEFPIGLDLTDIERDHRRLGWFAFLLTTTGLAALYAAAIFFA